VRNDALTTYKVLALSRLVRPLANIPSTTALGTVGLASGHLTAFRRGANVIMPCLTPRQYRADYAIYPGKTSVYDGSRSGLASITRDLQRIGRRVGTGRGDSLYRSRTTMEAMS
jgi:biotin synthase